MALVKIKGQNFRVFKNESAIPEATSCNITISGNMEDASHKDIVSDWDFEQMTSKSWQAEVDSLQATEASLKALISDFLSDVLIPIGFDQTEGSQNRTASNAPFARSGNAHLIDVSIQASNRQNIVVSTTYQGSGPLA